MVRKEKALEIATLINNHLQGDVLFVGGIAELFRGTKTGTKDIDIIVDGIDKLIQIGPVFDKKKSVDGYDIYFMHIDGVYIDINVSKNDIEKLSPDEYEKYNDIKISTLERDLLWLKRNLGIVKSQEARRLALKSIKRLENLTK